jgi:hypothetical protein
MMAGDFRLLATAVGRSRGGSVALGGVAGYAFEGVAEGAFGGVAELAGEDGDGSVLLSEGALSKTHAPFG